MTLAGVSGSSGRLQAKSPGILLLRVACAAGAIAAILTRRAGQSKLQPFSKGSPMRQLLAIIALSAISYAAGAAPTTAAAPDSMSWDASASNAFGRQGVVVARGMGGGTRPQGGGMGNGSGGMNCGANCGGGGMGGGGSSGGMGGGGSSGGMGGAGGGTGGGAQGFGPLFGVPRTNCPDHRHKADRRQPAQNSEQESGSMQCPESR
jgi:hypothetical protein